MDENFGWKEFNPTKDAHKVLHGFLVMDVQFEPSSAAELLEDIRQVRAGKVPSKEAGGNAYFADITKNGVTFNCTLDDTDKLGPQTLPLDAFESAVSAWEEHTKRRKQSR